MKFPRAEAEKRRANLEDLWTERDGVSWGYLVLNALRAREIYVVRRGVLDWPVPDLPLPYSVPGDTLDCCVSHASGAEDKV